MPTHIGHETSSPIALRTPVPSATTYSPASYASGTVSVTGSRKGSVTRSKAVTRPALNVASAMRTMSRGCGSNTCRSFRSRETKTPEQSKKEADERDVGKPFPLLRIRCRHWSFPRSDGKVAPRSSPMLSPSLVRISSARLGCDRKGPRREAQWRRPGPERGGGVSCSPGVASRSSSGAAVATRTCKV